jgi:hypothetical protein
VQKVMQRVMLGFLTFAASFGASSFVKLFSTQFFLVAPAPGAVQNEDHSTVALPIPERSI